MKTGVMVCGHGSRDEAAVRTFVERFGAESVTPRVAELLRIAVSGRGLAPAAAPAG